jgi:hypothetical protein
VRQRFGWRFTSAFLILAIVVNVDEGELFSTIVEEVYGSLCGCADSLGVR